MFDREEIQMEQKEFVTPEIKVIEIGETVNTAVSSGSGDIGLPDDI